MGKRIPVVTVAEPAAAARLAQLPLEASVAMADVAAAIKDGLLAFASMTGLVVMQQMMEAELTRLLGPKHARIRRPPREPARQHRGLGHPRRPEGQRRTAPGPHQPWQRGRPRHLGGLLDGGPARRGRHGAHAGRGGHPPSRRRRRAARRRARGPRERHQPLRRVAPLRAGHDAGPRRAHGARPVGPRRSGAHDRRHRGRQPVLRGGPGHHQRRAQAAGRPVASATPRTRSW